VNSSIEILSKKSTKLDRFAKVKNTKFLPTLWFFTDYHRNPDPFSILNQLPKNTGVVFRDYKAPKRKKMAKEMADFCKKNDLILLIGGDSKLALEVGASGIHIPQFNNLSLPYLRPKKSEWIISASVHSKNMFRRVNYLGANIIFLSPFFHTLSHPYAKPRGRYYLNRLTNEFSIFSIALGGINTDTITKLNGSGINGIAAISGFFK